MYSDGLKRYLEQQNKTPATADLINSPNAADILKQYRENTLAALESQRQKQEASNARGQQMIADARAREEREANDPLGTILQNATGNSAGKNMFMNRVNTTSTAAMTRQTAADRAAQQAMRAETVDNPEWLSSLRPEEEIKADLDKAKTDSTKAWWADRWDNFMARLTNAVNQSNVAIPTVEEPGYTRSAEAAKRTQNLKDELAQRQWAKFESLRNNPDFTAKSQYKSSENGKETVYNPLTDNYDSIGFDPEYEFINGSKFGKEAQTILSNEKRKVQQDSGGPFAPVPDNFEFTHLSGMKEDEKALYNYIYATNGPNAAHEYLNYLRSDLYARQMKKEKDEAAAYAEKHPVMSTVGSIAISPLRGWAYVGQAADYLTSGKIDQNAPYNRIAALPKAEREVVTRNVERNWGKAGSFAYGVGVSMAEFLLNSALTGGGAGTVSEGLSLALMGSGAAADATIEAKERGLSDNQSFALGTMAGLAEIATEKISIENLFTRKWEVEPIRYLLKNTIAEGSEEAGSDLINWFADVLVSRDKSEWQESINAYKKQGLSEKDAFNAALKDKGVEILTDAAAGALSGFLMAVGPSAKGIRTEAKYPVSSRIAFEENGTERLGAIDASVQNALETADNDERLEALADYVYEMGRSFPGARNDGTLNATRQAIKYLQETVKSTNDADLKENLKELESDLRNNQWKIEERVGELNEIRSNNSETVDQADTPEEQESAPADEWGFLPDDQYANRDMDEAELEFIHDANETFETTITSIADAPADSLVNETADLVTKVAETTEPDEDVIRATVNKVNDGIKTIDKVIDAVENQFSSNLYTWLNDEETRVRFPMIADIQNRTPTNLLPSTTETYQGMQDNAPEAYRQYVLNELKVRRAVLEQIDSVLRNRKQDVKQAVTDILTQIVEQTAPTEDTMNADAAEAVIGNPVMQADGESLAPQTQETVEAAPGEPKYTVSRKDYTHTKNKKKFDLVQFEGRLSKTDYAELKEVITRYKGFWSPYANGFLIPEGRWSEVENALGGINVGVNEAETPVNTPAEVKTESERETPVETAGTSAPEVEGTPGTETESSGVDTEENDISDIANDPEAMRIIDQLPKVDPKELEGLYDSTESVMIKGAEITPEKLEQLLKIGKRSGDRIVFAPKDFRGVIKGDTKFQNAAAKHTFVDLTNGNFVTPKFADGWTRIQFEVNPLIKQVSEILTGETESQIETEKKSDREPVAPTPKKKAEETVDNAPEQGYTETEAETETTAEPESEYAVGDVVEVGGEYYEVVAIENGEPQLEPYTSEEAETSYDAGDIIEYNGKSYRIVEFDENGDAVLQEYRPPKENASGVSYALGEPERITLSASDFKKAVQSNQIRKVTPTGTRNTTSGTRTSGNTAPRKQGTGRISLSDLQKKGSTGATLTKITDKSVLRGIVNGKKVSNPAPQTRKPRTASNNTVKENGNENEGLRGTDSGRNEGNGGRNRPLGGESADGDGGRVSGPVQEAQEEQSTERGAGEPRENVRADGGRTGEVADGERDSGESVRSESVSSTESDAGGDERDNGTGDGGRASERPAESSGRNGTSRVTLNKNRYTFDADDVEYINSTKPRFEDNVAAIRILKDIEASGRKATPEEKKVLARYKGWGGLANAFNTWTKEYQSLSQLMTREELEAARASTTNAHYTDLEVVSAIYDGLKRMGLKGGNILEPSMGTGNFFGAMPKALSNRSNLYGVEMDSLTGRIAKVLYPDANIMIAPFQQARYEDNQFDAIVGNVPFSEVTYPYKGKKYTLHDYFFVKSLDHLKPGGIMMAITSTGTLDSGSIDKRNALASKADLIAAYRLPGGMFETNAGTKVTTDLLVFRKRPEGLAQSAETFSGMGTIEAYNADTGEMQDASINEYYVRHPENILGESIMDKGMYREYRLQARPFENADYKEILAQAMKRLPANIMGTEMTADEVRIRNDSLKSGLTETDGKIYFKDALTGEVTPWNGKKADMARDYLKIRDAYLGLINLSTQANVDPKQLEGVRKTLNAAYDAFVKKYGNLLQTGNGKPKSTLQGDSYYNMVASIEQKGKEKGTFEKSPILTMNTFRKPKVEHVDTAHDALAVSLAEKGKIDFDYMTELSGMSKADLLEQLGDSVYETPDGDYQFSEVYFSGNVREKLRRAREAAEQDKRFERNVKALEAVMPKDVPAQNISVTIGASWIPVNVYRDFVREVFRGDPKISRNSQIGGWVIEGYAGRSVKYGDVDVRKLLESTMNQRMIKVKTKGVLDAKATQEIQEKQKQLRNEFSAWIFANSDRRAALETLYNEKYNSWRGADYSQLADALTFEGKNPGIDLRDYQRTAIARAVFGGNTLLAHGVGTGKTFETIATAMESKRLGITHKNLFVVPKNKVYDFQRDILKLYPNARIMIADDSDFKKENRPRMIASLATNDFDIAVIGHSQFAFIPLSPETERATINQQLEEYRAILEEEAGPQTDQYGRRIRKQKSRSVKDIEKAIARLEARLEELQVKKRDNTLTFEQLGIDGLFVDEAHNFKNLPFATTLNVPGVKNSDAQRAGDMFAKTNYLHSTGGRVVFATATPITNSMSELYNMTRFVSPETFREAGIYSFDDWANTFGEVVSGLEVSPDGVHFRIKDRFAKFKNAQQMLGLFHQYADIKKTEEVIKELPKAVRIDVTCETNDLMQSYISKIADRIDGLKRTKSAASDNMLLITSDGKAAATDLRLIADQLEMDPSDLDLPGSKINRTVENVLKEYKDTKKTKGVQLVFLDMGLGTNNKRYHYNLYSDLISKLIKGGIKQEEIVRIDAVAPKDLDELFTRVKAGEVRVLIGSNARMGEGLNVQDKIVAMHEVMPTNKPSEIQQSEGRAIRYGNENPEVRIYRYIQEGSFDSYMWQQLERKARFVNVAMSKGDVSEIEDVDDFVLSAAEGKALATGNPLLLEKAELDNRYTELSAAYRVYQEQQYSAKATIDHATQRIAAIERQKNEHREDMRKINATPEAHFVKGSIPAEESPFIIEGKEYRDHKEINDAIAKVLKNGKYALHSHHVIGSLRGIDIEFNPEPSMNYLLLKFASGERTIADVTTDGDNAIKILNALNGNISPNYENGMNDALSYQQQQLKDAQDIYGEPFEQQAEYDATTSRLQQVNAELFEKAGGDFDFIDEEDPNLQGGDFDSDDDGGNQYSLGATKGIFGNGNHDENAEVPSISDLWDEAKKSFKIPINTGRMGNVPKTAQGIFKEGPETIRTRRYGNLPTLAHEIGHWYDKKYNLRKNAAVREISAAFEDNLRERGYSTKQIPGEAVAEYFRAYMENSELTERRFPKFTNWVNNQVSDADMKRLNGFAEKSNAYFGADVERRAEVQVHYRTDEAVPAIHSPVNVQAIKEDPYGYFGGKAKAFNRTMVDDIRDLRGVGRAYDLAFLAKRANSIAAARLKYNMTDLNGNVVGDGLAPILSDAGIESPEIKRKFDEYLIARRALDHFEANKRGENLPTLVYAEEELNTEESLVERIQQMEDAFPSFHDASERLYVLQNQMLDLAVDSGIMTEETRNRLNELYPHYVPLFRVMDDEQVKAVTGTKMMSNRSPIARFKGSMRDIYSPIENIMVNMAKYTSMSIEAQIKRNIYDFATQTEGMGWFAEEVPASKILDYVSTDEIKKKLDAAKKNEESLDKLTGAQKEQIIDEIVELIGDSTSQWKIKTKQGTNIMPVMVDGQVHYLEIHDENLLKSLAGLEPKQYGWLTQQMGKVTRFEKNFFTGINVKFAFTNVARDLMTGYVSSTTTSNPFKYLADFGKAFWSSMREDEAYQNFQLQGGGYMGSYTSDYNRMKALVKEISGDDGNRLKQILNTAKQFVPRIIDAGENASRQAEFYRAIDKGFDNLDAFRMSQEVTVNFDRGGNAVKAINQWIPYRQAAANSLYHMIDLFSTGGSGGRNISKAEAARNRKNFIIKWIGSQAFMAALTALLSYGIARMFKKETKEQVYEARANLSKYRKNNYWNIYVGDGKFIEIRKETMLNTPINVIERLIEYSMLEQGDALDGMAQGLVDAWLPLDIFDPLGDIAGSTSVVGTVYDLVSNKDFKGTPIVSSRYQNLPKAEQYSDSTSEIWKGVANVLTALPGNVFDASPIQLQYAFEDNFGFYAQAIDRATSRSGGAKNTDGNILKRAGSGALNAGKAFVEGTFTADSVYSTDILNTFYDQKDAYDKGKAGYNANPNSKRYGTEDVLGAYKYGKVADLYSDLNKFVRAENDDDLSREMRKRVNALIAGVNKEGISDLDQAVIDLAESTGVDVTDIAPYVVFKDHVTAKVNKQNQRFDLSFDDMIAYYTQARKGIEDEYKRILQSGYDDATTAEMLATARKEKNKECEDYWKSLFVERAKR